jgi:lysophospholipase L1-like esterase
LAFRDRLRSRPFVNGLLLLLAGAAAYYAVRVWMQPESTRPATVIPSAAGKPTAVKNPTGPLVILGASYAGSWPLSVVAGIPVINNGVAGQRTFQFLERFDRDVVERAPRAVLLWGFINNFFSADNLDEAAAAIRADYTQMIAKAKAAGIEPILATEITVRRHEGLTDRVIASVARIMGKTSQQDRINGYVMATNRWLAEVGRAEGLLVMDFQGALADASGQRRLEFAAEDGSHVTAAGYETLSTYVRPILERHFGASNGGGQ